MNARELWQQAQEVLGELRREGPALPPLDAPVGEQRAFMGRFLAQAAGRMRRDQAELAARMLLGLGLLEPFLGDDVEEVLVRGGTVRVLYRDGRKADHPDALPAAAVESLARRVADATRRAMAGGRQFAVTDVPRPGGGKARLSAVAPPVSQVPALNVRLFPPEPPRLEVLGYPPGFVAALREVAFEAGGLLIAGPFGAGKTTLLNALLLEAVALGLWPCVVEAFAELQGPLDRVAQLELPDAAQAAQAMGEAVFRLRADVLAVGEITSPEEAWRFLWLALAGRPVWATIHGASPRQARTLLGELACRGGVADVRGALGEGLRTIVQLGYDVFAHQRCAAVVEVGGRVRWAAKRWPAAAGAEDGSC